MAEIDLSRASLRWQVRFDALLDKLVQAGADDWFQPHEVVWLVKSAGSADSSEGTQQQAILIIRELLERGLIVAGDIDGGRFRPWNLTPRETMHRIELAWASLPEGPSLGDICWFDLTKNGEARAKELP